MSNLTLVEKQLSPKLRFKEFSGSWLLQRASDLFENSRIKGNGELPIYSVTLDRGMVRRDSLERRMGNDAKATDNLLVLKGDISYNMMRMWQGAYGQAPEDCMVSPAYVVLHPKEDTSAEFFIRYFERSRSRYLFTSYSYGLTSDRLRLYFKDFARIKYATPSLPEQQKIAAFLSAVDQKIQQLTRKKELLESYKKGLMQQLFSGDLRFKDEEGKAYPDWEEKRLGEVATFLKGKGISKKETDPSGEFECIRYGELYTIYKETIDKTVSRTSLPVSQLVLSKKSDVIIPASGESQLDIATASCVIRSGIALGGDLNIIRSDIHGVFLAFYLNGPLKLSVARLAQGASVLHLYSSQLKTLKLRLPCFEEQEKISSSISIIDDKITSISAQITHTQTFKKGLLQQMFV